MRLLSEPFSKASLKETINRGVITIRTAMRREVTRLLKYANVANKPWTVNV
jgi:hypothetical protein